MIGTERGLAAGAESRAEINELITALEAQNPTTVPTEALESLAGTWRLVYTSNSELFLLLAADRLPGVKVGEVTQTIDAGTGTVENKVEFEAPLVKSSVSANAAFEVRSPKRLAVKFQSGTLAVPTIFEDVVMALPSELTLLGQTIDLGPLNQAVAPLQSALAPALASGLKAVKDVLAGQSDLKVPIPSQLDSATQSWLLTTYLDDDTRIARGDGGSVFVLTKEVAIVPETSPAAEVAAAPPPTPAPVVEPEVYGMPPAKDE